jgi:hypothetical protein
MLIDEAVTTRRTGLSISCWNSTAVPRSLTEV